MLAHSLVPKAATTATGGTAGGQIGYRWQTGAWVFGLEAQGNWADFNGSNVSLGSPAGSSPTLTKIDAFGLFTGQVGYAWNNALLYVKGGAAVTDNRYRTFVDADRRTRCRTGSDDTRWGGVVGVGVEYGFAPNWSAGVEYDHMFMQDQTVSFTDTADRRCHRSPTTASVRTSISSPSASTTVGVARSIAKY